MTSLSSSSESDDAEPPSNHFMMDRLDKKTKVTKAMQVGIKRRRAHFKFKLPVQDMLVKGGSSASHDFQPIIIEEVFYNGKQANISHSLMS